MDENRIKQLYTESNWTLRMVADKFGTDHHKIRRILVKMGVPIVRIGKPRKPFSDEHRRKISETSKGRPGYWTGKKMTAEQNLKNMSNHLRHDIEVEWLMKFPDIEKLKFLNRSISRKRDFGNHSKEFYKAFINKFYYDAKFNAIYEAWMQDKSNNLLKPSPDHIKPKVNGMGDIENIRFVTWFENRCKNNMSLDQWESVKKNIGKYFI
jgi:hypothetical protein